MREEPDVPGKTENSDVTSFSLSLTHTHTHTHTILSHKKNLPREVASSDSKVGFAL